MTTRTLKPLVYNPFNKKVYWLISNSFHILYNYSSLYLFEFDYEVGHIEVDYDVGYITFPCKEVQISI